jgi:hypothetical protein
MADASFVKDQYRDSAKLSARIALHHKYGGPGGGFAGLAAEIAIAPGAHIP